jgi:hypothetical protein
MPGLTYLHIPKTAGTSLRVAVEKSLGPRKLVVFEREENLFDREYDEIADDVVVFGHLSWAFADLIGSRRRATTLRAPMERCASQIVHWISGGKDQFETRDDGGVQRVIEPNKGVSWNLEYLIDRVDLPQFRALNNAQTAQLAGSHIFRDNELPEEAFELAAAHMDSCEVVGLTEEFDAFIANLGTALGHPIDVRGRNNVGMESARDVLTGLEPRARSKLTRLNEMDIELYERAKPLAARKIRKGAKPKGIDLPARGLRLSFGGAELARPGGYPDKYGRLPLQFFHLIFDLVELQTRTGSPGAGFLDLYAEEREIFVFRKLFGDAGLYVAPAKQTLAAAGAPANKNWPGVHPTLGDGDPGPEAGIALAIVAGLQPAEDLLRTCRGLFRALGSMGCVWVTDLAAWGEAGATTSLLTVLAAQYGVCAVAVLDRHVLFAPRRRAWLIQALFRAKLRANEVARTRLGACDVLHSSTRF